MKNPPVETLVSLRARMRSTHEAEKGPSPLQAFFIRMVGFSRWLLVMAILIAPWIYGGTRPKTIILLNAYLLSLLVAWVCCALLSRRPIRVNPLCFWACALLLIQGWWMTFNAKFVYDFDYSMFSDFPRWIAAGPGSVDRQSSFSMMLRMSALLGVIIMCMDMSQHRKWRMRLWITVCIAGISIVLLGLIQKMAGAPMIFWEKGRIGYFFFATFLYHGNAGAFINLVLPMVVGLTSLVFQKAQYGAMALLAPGSILCLAAAFSHASKAAIIVSVCLILAMTVWQARLLLGTGQGLSQKVGNLMSASIGGVAVVAVIIAVGWHFAALRWNFFDVSRDSRLFTYNIARSMIPDSGAFGFGPGTFSIMFDRYALDQNPQMPVFFRYAHQDYLQALLEWGWFGAALLGLILFGAIVLAFWRSFFKGARLRLTERLLLFSCGLSLLGVAMHAAVDFPLQIYSLQLFTAVYVGLVWKSSTWLTEHPRQKTSRRDSQTNRAPSPDPQQRISPLILNALEKRAANQKLNETPSDQPQPPAAEEPSSAHVEPTDPTPSNALHSQPPKIDIASPLPAPGLHVDQELDLGSAHRPKLASTKRTRKPAAAKSPTAKSAAVKSVAVKSAAAKPSRKKPSP